MHKALRGLPTVAKAVASDLLSAADMVSDRVECDLQKSAALSSAALSNIEQQLLQVLVANTDSTTLLPQIALFLQKIFGVDCCSIIALPSFSESPYIASWPEDYTTKNWLHWLGSWVESAVLSGQPSAEDFLVVVDASTNAPAASDTNWCAMPSEVVNSPFKSILGITTRVHGQINGVISLMRSQPHLWTTAERTLLKATSKSVSIAISQVQLQQRVHQQDRRQALIRELSTAIRSAQDLDLIFEIATRGTAQTLNADRSLLLQIKYADPLHRGRSVAAKLTVASEWVSEFRNIYDDLVVSSATQSDTGAKDRSFSVDDCSFCLQAFSTSPEPVNISRHQLTVMGTGHSAQSLIFDLDEFRALLLLPLENQGTVFGFLGLQCKHDRIWQQEDLDLAGLISAQVSAAMIQTQTLRRVQTLVEERTAQLQRSLEVQAKLYEKTRQQIDQLRELNQLKDEFLATMSHELRTPLTSMALAIRMLRCQSLPPERQGKYLDILDEQCTQEINLINDLLALQQLEAKQTPISLQKVNLISFLEDLARTFEQKWMEKRLKFSVRVLSKRPLNLHTDLDSLNRILIELLTNAGKYSDPETVISLDVDYFHPKDREPQITLALSNTGLGISPQDLPCIFDKFRRGQGVTEQAVQGTGLGLALVRSLVQHLSGHIEVSSDPLLESQSYKTQFRLTLPQSLECPLTL